MDFGNRKKKDVEILGVYDEIAKKKKEYYLKLKSCEDRVYVSLVDKDGEWVEYLFSIDLNDFSIKMNMLGKRDAEELEKSGYNLAKMPDGEKCMKVFWELFEGIDLSDFISSKLKQHTVSF